jgi:hypothetical protein
MAHRNLFIAATQMLVRASAPLAALVSREKYVHGAPNDAAQNLGLDLMHHPQEHPLQQF